ncbi:polysaccharide deacetylase family protein [Mixta sp. Marseille-Q2659]|uniref:polysaccharide deacetylase family protein n=1 Tax=Mixta sp. Marseille-Q2659 TaxID=2736607 RepID=UPI0023B8D3D5|nr:polysaccharide deacetylase family protein [Mixta sp. Marseille-Q2659]
MNKPAFLITIDTEGDNLWRNRRTITTRNTLFLPRFQALCEKYGFKPTWLTNYEMASDPAYVEFARDVITRRQGEVGMHLHAWNSPPETPLTDDDWRWQPYLIEYPDNLLRDKVRFMTELLEDKFQTKMLSHRAGRWAFDERYAAVLRELGYQVDCSVTPRVSWRNSPGAPQGQGGTDYTHFPSHAYFLDPHDISRSGNSTLLEVPMSIQYKHSALMNKVKQGYDRLRGKKRGPSVNWLRPAGGNLAAMKRVAEATLTEGGDYVEFMLHSSEFMPDGSPTFKNEADIERLYDDLDALFSWLQQRTQGMTLAEYYQYFQAR